MRRIFIAVIIASMLVPQIVNAAATKTTTAKTTQKTPAKTTTQKTPAKTTTQKTTAKTPAKQAAQKTPAKSTTTKTTTQKTPAKTTTQKTTTKAAAKTPAKSTPKPSIDAQIAAEEKKRTELAKQVQDYRKQIKAMGAKVEGLLTKVNTLQQDESVARQELTLLELQNQKIQENIDVLNANIKDEQVKINELSRKMEDRILDIYKYGQSGQMRTLFASRSVLEAVDLAHLLKIVNTQDEAILSQLQARMQNLDMSKQTMDDQQTRLREKTQAVQDQRDKYNENIKETNAFINSLRRKKELAEKAVKEAEEAQQAAGAMIAELQRKRSKVYLPSGKGTKFDWPLRAPMSSPFGYRIHPILKRKILHAGIDLAAPNGTPVKAPAPGEVIYDGWLRGYGRVVVLDHGRGFSTLYAHLSASLVKEGQEVKAGQVIARVGKTGNVTGYHLHFEVRVYGTPENPIKYLKK